MKITSQVMFDAYLKYIHFKILHIMYMYIFHLRDQKDSHVHLWFVNNTLQAYSYLQFSHYIIYHKNVTYISENSINIIVVSFDRCHEVWSASIC